MLYHPLLAVTHVTILSFLLQVDTQTCLCKPIARGHYPKSNLGSQTNSHLCFIFRAAVHTHSASQAVSPAGAQVCSILTGPWAGEAKGQRSSFWQKQRDYFLLFVLEGTTLSQKWGRSDVAILAISLELWDHLNDAFIHHWHLCCQCANKIAYLFARPEKVCCLINIPGS